MGLIPAGTIGIVTTDPKSLISRFVYRAQRILGASHDEARWTHCFLVGWNGDLWEAFPDDGWGVSDLHETLAGDGFVGREIKWFFVPGLTYVGIERMLHRAEWMLEDRVEYSNLPYLAHALDLLHLPSAWLRNRVRRAGRVNCSSSIASLLQEGAGIYLFADEDPLRRTPCDFYKAWQSGQLIELQMEAA